MAESNELSADTGAERQKLLTHLKSLGLTTDDELVEMHSTSPGEFQEFIDELVDTKKSLQEDFMRLITIKEVIEKYLSRLISEMLDGRDVIGSLQQGMEIYPSLQFVRWLVRDVERDLTEFIKDLDLDSDYVLPILYRWKYEYKPLNDIWWELIRREQGRKNAWTSVIREPYYNQLRHIPQISIQILSGKKVVWNAREDADDIAHLVRILLTICLDTLNKPQEHFDVSSIFLKRMQREIRRIEETIEELKVLPILSPENASEDSANTQ